MTTTVVVVPTVFALVVEFIEGPACIWIDESPGLLCAPTMKGALAALLLLFLLKPFVRFMGYVLALIKPPMPRTDQQPQPVTKAAPRISSVLVSRSLGLGQECLSGPLHVMEGRGRYADIGGRGVTSWIPPDFSRIQVAPGEHVHAITQSIPRLTRGRFVLAIAGDRPRVVHSVAVATQVTSAALALFFVVWWSALAPTKSPVMVAICGAVLLVDAIYLIAAARAASKLRAILDGE